MGSWHLLIVRKLFVNILLKEHTLTLSVLESLDTLKVKLDKLLVCFLMVEIFSRTEYIKELREAAEKENMV